MGQSILIIWISNHLCSCPWNGIIFWWYWKGSYSSPKKLKGVKCHIHIGTYAWKMFEQITCFKNVWQRTYIFRAKVFWRSTWKFSGVQGNETSWLLSCCAGVKYVTQNDTFLFIAKSIPSRFQKLCIHTSIWKIYSF